MYRAIYKMREQRNTSICASGTALNFLIKFIQNCGKYNIPIKCLKILFYHVYSFLFTIQHLTSAIDMAQLIALSK